MKIMQAAIGVCLCLIGCMALASNDTPEIALQNQLKKMVSLQGEFTQALYDADHKLIGEKSSGSFLLQRPGRFYWETKAPYPQVLVSDQTTVWLYEPDLEQVTVRPFSDELGQTPALLLSNDAAGLSEKFLITSEITKTQQTFTLTAKEAQKLFTSIQMVFVADVLESLIIHDSLEQQTVFRLIDTTVNLPMDAAAFVFTIPEGVDVLID